MMSQRKLEFAWFAHIVEQHIENYTVPQYGDAPDDQVEEWTPIQCMDSIKRYANRLGSNRRGRIEALRDMAKIAHYAGLAFMKLKPTQEEIYKVTKGGM